MAAMDTTMAAIKATMFTLLLFSILMYSHCNALTAHLDESRVIPIKPTVKGQDIEDVKPTIYRDAEMANTTTEIPNATTEMAYTTTEIPNATTEMAYTTTEIPNATTEMAYTTTEIPNATTEMAYTTTEIPKENFNVYSFSAEDPKIEKCFSYNHSIGNLLLKCSGLFGRDSHRDSFIIVIFKTQTCSVITWENEIFECIVKDIINNIPGPVFVNISSRTYLNAHPINGTAHFDESLVIPIKPTVKGQDIEDVKPIIYRDSGMANSTTEIPNENSNVYSFFTLFIIGLIIVIVIVILVLIYKFIVKKLRDTKSDNMSTPISVV